MKQANGKRGRHVAAAAVLLALGLHTTTVAPVASADKDGTTLACAVPSGLFAEWARKLAGSRYGIFTTVVGGAAVTYGCTKAFENLDSGRPSLFNLQTPDGSVISQQLSPGDFVAPAPTYRRAASRDIQCLGWRLPSLYTACLNYQLDPL